MSDRSPATPSVAPVKARLLQLLDEVIAHDGYGSIKVDVRLLKKGQKEVIVDLVLGLQQARGQTSDTEAFAQTLTKLFRTNERGEILPPSSAADTRVFAARFGGIILEMSGLQMHLAPASAVGPNAYAGVLFPAYAAYERIFANNRWVQSLHWNYRFA